MEFTKTTITGYLSHDGTRQNVAVTLQGPKAPRWPIASIPLCLDGLDGLNVGLRCVAAAFFGGLRHLLGHER